MKSIASLLIIILVNCCTPVKKENNQQDSVAHRNDTVVINPNLNPAFSTTPAFRTYSLFGQHGIVQQIY
jgi:hypothetical protein